MGADPGEWARSGPCLPPGRPPRTALLLTQASRRPCPFPSSPSRAPNTPHSPRTTPMLGPGQAPCQPFRTQAGTYRPTSGHSGHCPLLRLLHLGDRAPVHRGLGPGRSCPELNHTFQPGCGSDLKSAAAWGSQQPWPRGGPGRGVRTARPQGSARQRTS